MLPEKLLNPSHRTYLWGMVGLLFLAAALRLYALTADAPIYLSNSQGINTDGPITISAARDKALFDSWEPHTYQIKQFYLYPALSWLTYFFFSLLGIGYWQANFAIVVSGLLSIVFTAAFAQEQFGRRVAWLSTLFMAINFPYLMYNRIPMVYTPLSCGLALALFCWGRGLRRPTWFFWSGLVTAFTILYVKVIGVSFLPVAGGGFLILAWRRWKQEQPGVYNPLMFFISGGALVVVVWYFHIFIAESRLAVVHPYRIIATQTFNPTLELEENIRFAVRSILQFGIFSGFFVRLFPLFALAYGYLFYRSGQLLAKNRPVLRMGEVVILLLLISTVLMLLTSSYRPMRYMILLILPMSLAAAIALDAWLRLDRPTLPAQFGKLYPIFIQIGLSYLIYQFLATVFQLRNVLRLNTGLISPEATIGITAILYQLLAIALLVGSLGTLIFLWRVLHVRRYYISLPSLTIRSLVAIILLVTIIGGDLYQYWRWTRNLQYSIIEASHDIGQNLGEGAILGGPYAYALTLENKIPAIGFYSGGYPGDIRNAPFTHLAVDADGVLNNGPYNDDRMYESYPELMARAKLYKTYSLRGYLIKIYEIEPY